MAGIPTIPPGLNEGKKVCLSFLIVFLKQTYLELHKARFVTPGC